MQVLKTHGITQLNPLRDSKGLLLFRANAVVDLPSSQRCSSTVFHIAAVACEVTLRCLGEDRFVDGCQCVTVCGGPVLLVVTDGAFQVLVPEATVKVASEAEAPKDVVQEEDAPIVEEAKAFDLESYKADLAECRLIKDVNSAERSAKECVSGDAIESVAELAELRRTELRESRDS